MSKIRTSHVNQDLVIMMFNKHNKFTTNVTVINGQINNMTLNNKLNCNKVVLNGVIMICNDVIVGNVTRKSMNNKFWIK